MPVGLVAQAAPEQEPLEPTPEDTVLSGKDLEAVAGLLTDHEDDSGELIFLDVLVIVPLVGLLLERVNLSLDLLDLVLKLSEDDRAA